MNKNTKKLFEFLYNSKKQGANYCFCGFKTIGVRNWNNIMSYREKYDLLKQTGINENILIGIINEESNINKNIEIRSNGLMIGLTDKGIENYKESSKKWYEKINIDWKWFIGIIIALISAFITYLKLI